MSKIKIITDSACDIDLKIAQKNDIAILPITITADNKEYKESYDFTKLEFYKMLPAFKEIPTTSQIPPLVIYEEIQNAMQTGYTDVLLLTISKHGSATFHNAITAREEFYKQNKADKQSFPIHIIDTNTFSFGYGFPVLRAIEMIKNSVSADKILNYFEDWFSRLELFFTISDLTYAKKSGRIGSAAAIAGELLGIKPIINLTGGQTSTYKKVRGRIKSFETLIEIAQERITINKSYCIVSADNDKEETAFSKMVKAALGKKPMSHEKIGAAVTINAGTDLIGIGFLGEKREGEKVIY